MIVSMSNNLLATGITELTITELTLIVLRAPAPWPIFAHSGWTNVWCTIVVRCTSCAKACIAGTHAVDAKVGRALAVWGAWHSPATASTPRSGADAVEANVTDALLPSCARCVQCAVALNTCWNAEDGSVAVGWPTGLGVAARRSVGLRVVTPVRVKEKTWDIL